MDNEENRLATFTNWPKDVKISPEALARAGLYFSGHGDKVICYACEGELEDWGDSNDPAKDHASFYPSCPLSKARKTGASLPSAKGGTKPDSVLKKPPDDHPQPVLVERTADLSLSRTWKVEYPQYEDPKSRLDTFDKWRKSSVLTKEELVDAGFFFTDEGDKVRCFTCGLVLENWERGDKPFEEHRKYAQKCPFVLSKLKEKDVQARQVPTMAEEPKYLQGATLGSPVQEQFKLPTTLSDDTPCIVCKQRPREILFEPCSHFIMCEICAKNFEICPICQTPIQRKSKYRRVNGP